MLRLRKGDIVIISGMIIFVSYLFKIVNLDLVYHNSLLIISTIIAGYSIFKHAIQGLRYRIIGIELLVSVAVIGALAIGEYFEGAAVTFLFILGSYLEAKTLEKTRTALKALMDLAPSKAIVIRDNKEIEIPADEVFMSEIVIVKPGGKIPVDGIIIKGEASINQASITGESIPVRKAKGDDVYCGTVLESGYLEINAEKVGDETSFAKIIEMVEEAQDSKAKTQKFIEKFAKYYTPGIMLLSLIVYFFSKDMELTLTLLVISCPGALVISTPVSIVAGIGNAAKNGILIKGGEYLEKANKIDIVAFDKTGTLTIGKPIVTNIINYHVSKDQLLEIAFRIEMNSEHHLAKAIVNKAKNQLKKDYIKAEEFEAFSGKGAKGKIDGLNYFIGNRKLMDDHGIKISFEIEEQFQTEEIKGQTAMFVAVESRVIGIISISDIVREDAYPLIKYLKQLGIKVIMLTGDNKWIAEAIGNQLTIDEVYSDLLPEDKVKIIHTLQEKHHVAMIGDGVNDAPSLASADIGISMGDVGTDVAIETSDVVLLSEQLNKLKNFFSLSKATNHNLKQNLSFALLVVFILLSGVLLGKVFMALGMLVHELSVIVVILNAIRLNRFKVKN